MKLIILILILAWIGSVAVHRQESKRITRTAVSVRTHDDEIKHMMAESKVETDRLIALEKARIEQEKWNLKQEEINRKHEAQLAKHEEQIRNLEFKMAQAEEDIENLAWRIEEAQRYSEYLETEISKCVPGGREYFKWQNKLSANDDKIYRLTKAMNKAQHSKAEAEHKLSEVA